MGVLILVDVSIQSGSVQSTDLCQFARDSSCLTCLLNIRLALTPACLLVPGLLTFSAKSQVRRAFNKAILMTLELGSGTMLTPAGMEMRCVKSVADVAHARPQYVRFVRNSPCGSLWERIRGYVEAFGRISTRGYRLVRDTREGKGSGLAKTWEYLHSSENDVG